MISTGMIIMDLFVTGGPLTASSTEAAETWGQWLGNDAVWLTALAALMAAAAALPAALHLWNLTLYRPAPPAPPSPDSALSQQPDALPAVSVLIPARNEAAAIAEAVNAARANDAVRLEVLVLDDHSTDQTAPIVAAIAATDPRVRLLTAPDLPNGWCGKQHACWVLAQAAAHPLLVFQDADVRLAPTALARIAAFARLSGADLVSGVPRQITGTLAERLILPLIHFVLLGFLPLAIMRQRPRDPGLGSGCGQLFAANRAAYFAVGGHGHDLVRRSLHDGIKLPRAFRSAGHTTDLFDATDLATCRMYRSASEVWFGLAKNATEGLAAPALIGPATVLLAGGQIAPAVVVAAAAAGWLTWPPVALALAVAALVMAYLPRGLNAWRFRQSAWGAAAHPLGVAMLLAIQWYALLASLLGRPAAWRGRQYPPPSAPAVLPPPP